MRRSPGDALLVQLALLAGNILTPHELFWIPILIVSLSMVSGALAAMITRTWRSDRPRHYKIAFTAFASLLIAITLRGLWHLKDLLWNALI